MTHPTDPTCAWNEATIERLNRRFDVMHDGDIGVDDWPAAMADPSMIEAALDAFDSPDTSRDERALIVELLLNTFEFCTVEREGNPDWRRTLDRLERDFADHALAIRRWAQPEEENPWLISDALQAILDRQATQ